MSSEPGACCQGVLLLLPSLPNVSFSRSASPNFLLFTLDLASDTGGQSVDEPEPPDV
jgi:hypothetical protein